ncbi:MMPL family transporter [Actinocatenispora comari]|uniref:Membrane protein n=1 Tax=Actinocatenispora comari TaxID=2807577 RepID=A0A8J4AB04_9ACTN|nr:MMPL family transporter [Actinocatenispora comari]GIL27420.1 membrane protein [Actinocatenispora comari]
MSGLLYRLGRFAHRRRWWVIAAWLVVLVGMATAAVTLKGTLADTFSVPGTPAQQTIDQLHRSFPAASGGSAQLVVQAPVGHSLLEPGIQRQVSATSAQLGKVDGVVGALSPYQAKTISGGEHRTGYISIQFAKPDQEVGDATKDRIRQLAGQLRDDGLRAEVGGQAFSNASQIGGTEAIGVVVAVVVLLIVFGSLIPALLPLVTALVGVGIGYLGITALSGAISMNSVAPVLALMIGLAVGIDYALFVVSRHRGQLRDGMPVGESIGRANATAGSAVVFAGTTVFIALAALSVVNIPFLTIMGLAAAGTVIVSVLVAVTLLPALLAVAGRRLDAVPLPILRRRQHRAGGERGLGARWAGFVTRRRVPVLIAGLIVLGVLAIPAPKLSLGLPDAGAEPAGSGSRAAYELIADNFGPGFNGPLVVAADLHGTADPTRAALAVRQRLAGTGVTAVAAPTFNADKTTAIITVIPSSGPNDQQTKDLVQRIRDDAGSIHRATGARIGVTGSTALYIDISSRLSAALPVFVLIVVGLSLVLLAFAFRSLLVPLKAAVGFVLSLLAAIGGVVAVYQWGWLAGAFHVAESGWVLSFLPILLIGVLFGLAMDYEVFLVSRMREEHSRHGDPQQAVRTGFRHGARVVTAAALIMISVFAGFVFGDNMTVASMGFALALGVLLDAFLVRMTLVPAVMSLLGRSAWWLPRWLDRILPHVDVEGAPKPERTPQPVA